MKTKLLKLALALTVMLSLFIIPQTVDAATEGYYTYSVSNGEATITSVDDTISGDVTIPDTLGGYPVASIGVDAFYECRSLTSITIPDSVTSIRMYAFKNCTSLTDITISSNMTEIGEEAFYNTGYYNDSSNWENDVLYIGNCLIKAKATVSGEYVVKEGTKVIADSAFSSYGEITSIIIPDSVTNIGEKAFYICLNLESVKLGKGITSIEKETFLRCETLNKIDIPDGVTDIGYRAFSYCYELESVTIPYSVKNISDYAFRNCEALWSVSYKGTQEMWENINIASTNDELTVWADIVFDPPHLCEKTSEGYSLEWDLNEMSPREFEKAYCYVVLYDSFDRVIDIVKKEVAAEDETVSIAITTDKVASKYSIMLWDAQSILKPLCSDIKDAVTN